MLSTKERKKNAVYFHLCYNDLCKRLNILPLAGVRAHLQNNTLDFNGDRVKLDDWGPILNALSMDRSLHFIAVRSKHPAKTVLEDIDNEMKARTVMKRPVLLTRFVLYMLSEALSACLSDSKVLTCMELEGLPLTTDYLAILCRGIAKCKSLQNLSFHRSTIGDEGCKSLCSVIKGMPTIISLDLSSCEISERGVICIAEMIKFQSIQRFSESWKQTLRYRQADTELMPGLRRITLNNNTQIGDAGIRHLMDNVREDIWLRALDLQNCGLGEAGAQQILNTLNFNASLYIVDVRANRKIQHDYVRQIMYKLSNNTANVKHEFQWLGLDPQLLKRSSSQILTTRATSDGHIFDKKRPAMRQSTKRAISTTKRSAFQRAQTFSLENKNTTSKFAGLPWRIDVRMKRRQEEPFEENPGSQRILQNLEPAPPHIPTPSPSPRDITIHEQGQELLKLEQRMKQEEAFRKELEIQMRQQQVQIQQLKELLQKEQVAKEGCCIINYEAYEDVQNTFERCVELMKTIRKSENMELLRSEQSQILNLSEVEQQSTLMKKCYSAHAKSDMKRPDLGKVSKSASGMRTNKEVCFINVERNIGDSAQSQRVSKDNRPNVSNRRVRTRRSAANKPNTVFNSSVFRDKQFSSLDAVSGNQNYLDYLSASDSSCSPARRLLSMGSSDSGQTKVQEIFQSLLQAPDKDEGVTATKGKIPNYLKDIKPKPLKIPSVGVNMHSKKLVQFGINGVQRSHENMIKIKPTRFNNESRDDSDQSSVSKSWSIFSNSSPSQNHYSTDEDEY